MNIYKGLEFNLRKPEFHKCGSNHDRKKVPQILLSYQKLYQNRRIKTVSSY